MQEVDKVDMVGKVGTNGLTKSSNANRAFELYARSRKGISRSLVLRSSSAKRQRARAIGLAMVFAAAVAIISASALIPVGAQTPLSEKILARPPGLPFTVFGFCWDGVDNTTVLAGVTVTVKNVNTSESDVYVTAADGYFAVDVSTVNPNFPTGSLVNDTINVTAVLGTKIGWSQAKIIDLDNPPVMWQDVTLNEGVAIPEFPMIIVPVLGMAALVAVVSIRRGRSEQ